MQKYYITILIDLYEKGTRHKQHQKDEEGEKNAGKNVFTVCLCRHVDFASTRWLQAHRYANVFIQRDKELAQRGKTDG